MKLFDKKYDKRSQNYIYSFLGIKIRIKNEQAIMQAKIDTLEKLLSLSLDITKLSKANGKLREVQLECLKIFSFISNICKEYNLKFWLDSGTLLGQVRHEGFIPWDDDIDLCMLRPDYDKLLSIIKIKLEGTDYYLREDKIPKTFMQSRIILKNSNNIGIDIFPVDMYSESDLDDARKQEVSDKIRSARQKFNKCFKKNLNKKQARAALVKIKEFTKKYILEDKDPAMIQPALFWGLEFLYRVKGQLVMNYDMIFPLKEITFEGVSCYIPNKTNDYLENIYGDYMSIPKNIVIRRED